MKPKQIFLTIGVALLVAAAILSLTSFSSFHNPQKAQLIAEIEEVDKECPINVGVSGDLLNIKSYPVQDGMEMVKVTDEGDKLIYLFPVDENKYDMSLMEAAIAKGKESPREKFPDSPFLHQIKVLRDLGKGFVCRIPGKSFWENRRYRIQ